MTVYEPTLGPWYLHDDDGEFTIWDDDARTIATARYLADAQLITAAPELLAVVRGLLLNVGSQIDTEWLERATVAIALAEGRPR